MFIAYAVYDNPEFGETTIKICTDMETENEWNERINDDSLRHLYYKRELPDIIMRLAARSELPAEFDFRGNKCKLLHYSCNDEERFYNIYRKNHVVDRVDVKRYEELIVYTGRCSCPRCYAKYGFDGIDNVCGMIGLKRNPKRTVPVDVQRCNRCLTYFIDQQSLELYERQYGELNVYRKSLEQFKRDLWYYDDIDNDYAPDSILSRNGYYARLDTIERRRALIHAMKNGVSKAEIKNKLTEFIERRGKRCPNAAVVWRKDLEFVNSYNLENEEKIQFK